MPGHPQNLSQLVLRRGSEVELECGDFLPIKGIVEYSAPEPIRVARFELNHLRRKSDRSSLGPSLLPSLSTLATSAPAPHRITEGC
jgi:hypothetical protein